MFHWIVFIAPALILEKGNLISASTGE